MIQGSLAFPPLLSVTEMLLLLPLRIRSEEIEGRCGKSVLPISWVQVQVRRMTFPTDWPVGCPSADTPNAEGEVYRIVKSNPATAADMLSHHETGRLPSADPCLRCGLSVFRILEDALNQQKLLPKLGKRIAKGLLTAPHGKACLTKGQQPTHTTWWPYDGADRVSIFVVVQEVA